jgi:Ca2+/Na+ antiporter
LSNEKSETFDAFASFVVIGILIWFVCRVVKAIVLRIVAWTISNQAMLYHLLLLAVAVCAVLALLYCIFVFVVWLIDHAKSTDEKLAGINEQMKKAVQRLDSHRNSLNGIHPRFDELWLRVNEIDQFTGAAEHRAILEKAKEAEAEVTGQREDDQDVDQE